MVMVMAIMLPTLLAFDMGEAKNDIAQKKDGWYIGSDRFG